MDSNFNPDAYLAAKAPDQGGFDPDAYIASKAPDEGAMMAAGRGAVRNFPFAQQAIAGIEPGLYGENLKDLTSKAEAAKAAHPIAYGTGAVAGTAAPLLIPGAGEALEAAPMLGNAALGAAQGLSDTNLGNPAQVVKDAAPGAVIGGALGGIGKLFASKAAPELEEAIAPADAVPKEAPPIPAPVETPAPILQPKQPLNEVAGMAVPNKKVASDFVPSAERVYASNLAQGFGGTPRQLMKVFGKHDPVQTLNEMGNWMETAGPDGKSLIGLMDRPGELLSKISDIHDAAGKQIGGIIEKAGANGSKGALADTWADLNEFAQKTADPQTEARIMKLIKTAEGLEDKPVSDFEAIQQLKEMAGKQIAKDPEMSPVYGNLADKAKGIVDNYGRQINNPSMRQSYTKAVADYHNSSRLLPILRYSEAKDLVGGPAGHHTLRGLLSTIINTAGASAGLPPVEQMGKNIALKAAPVARNIVQKSATTRAAAATVLNKLPAAARLELANALQGRFGKKNEP